MNKNYFHRSNQLFHKKEAQNLITTRYKIVRTACKKLPVTHFKTNLLNAAIVTLSRVIVRNVK